MTTILCATRGGEASVSTQEYAIAQAQERNASLVFLYVTDVQFLNNAGAPILVDVATEIENMGEFLLLMAQERAQKAEVQVSILTKRGVFRVALIEAVHEVGADLIVLGSPDERSLPTSSYLDNVIAAIREQTAVEVVIAED